MRLRPEGAGGLPCVCTSRAIDLAPVQWLWPRGLGLQCVAVQGGTQRAMTVARSGKTGVRGSVQG